MASWIAANYEEPEEKQTLDAAPHSVNYYSSGYYKRSMNETGSIASEIRAKKMLHYQDDDSVHLEEPVMSFFDNNAAPWVIHAERGILSNSGKELFLQGKVLAKRESSAHARAVSITTSDLKIDPEKSYAETAQPAELSSPPDITTGIGMQLHFSDPIQITLLKQVRGRYELQ